MKNTLLILLTIILLSCETRQPEPKGYWEIIETEMSAPHFDITIIYYDGQVVRYYDNVLMYHSIEHLGIETTHIPGSYPNIKVQSGLKIDSIIHGKSESYLIRMKWQNKTVQL